MVAQARRGSRTAKTIDDPSDKDKGDLYAARKILWMTLKLKDANNALGFKKR